MTLLSINPSGTKEKGREPEGCGQKEINMLKVAEKQSDTQVNIPGYSFASPSKKLGNWLDTLVERAKTKPISQIVSLTPEMAELLLNRNPHNRKINHNLVERYAYDIIGGRWAFNGEPIIVSDTGELNDGQHRCNAVIEAGKPIDVVMIVGVSRDTRTTLDQGRARTAGDYLAMEGHTITNTLAAAAGYAWQNRNYGRLDPKANRATKSEIIQFVDAHPALVRSVGLFEAKKARYLGGYAVFAFCHFAIGQVGRRDDVDSFFFSMVEGANLPKGDPALYARNRLTLLTGTRDQNAKAEIIFRAWNAFRRGEAVTRFHLSDGLLPILEG